jgi:hypothetical protein
MLKDRQIEAERTGLLTSDEFYAGWHFSDDWDGMLIQAGEEASKACTCSKCRQFWRISECLKK